MKLRLEIRPDEPASSIRGVLMVEKVIGLVGYIGSYFSWLDHPDDEFKDDES